jgi:hypothetical protein
VLKEEQTIKMFKARNKTKAVWQVINKEVQKTLNMISEINKTKLKN